MGRPIKAIAAQDLGVHPSITVHDETNLTPYLPRDHDRLLRDRLTQFREEGARSGLVIVVGTSCSGKSRTLYEAVRSVLPEWPLVTPRNDVELAEILTSGVPAGTIVWLDELQRHLTATHDGITAAAGIQALLAAGAGPIAFLGTIWPTNLAEIDQRPSPSDARTGASLIHHLLAGTRADRYAVPDGFADRHLNGAGADPRLQLAITTAAEVDLDGQQGRSVTQVLAGGTQLVDRLYPRADNLHSFSPATRALLRAAADLRRIGCPNVLPRWLLESVATSDLDPGLRTRLNPTTWFRDAIEEASRAAHEDNPYNGRRTLDIHHLGVPALSPSWTRDTEVFALHDYLYQDHLTRFRGTPVRSTIWAPVTRPENLERISHSTRRAIASKAAEHGVRQVAVDLAHALDDAVTASHVLVQVGAVDEAIAILQPSAEVDSGSATRLGRLLSETGNLADAVEVLRPFTHVSDPAVLMAELLVVMGRKEEAAELLKPASAVISDCAVALAKLHISMGRSSAAVDVLAPWIDSSADAGLVLANLLLSAGQVQECCAVLARGAAGSAILAVKLAKVLLRTGDPAGESEAIRVLLRHVKANQEASVLLADIYVSRGDLVGAIDMLALPARRFAQSAVRRATLLLAVGRDQEAVADLSRHIASGQEAPLFLADVYVGRGDTAGAVDMLALPAQRFPQSAVRRAALLLAVGRDQEAVADLSRHTASSQEASLFLADVYVSRGDLAGAVDMLAVPAQRLHQSAVRRAELLQQMNRLPDAIACLERFVARSAEAQWSSAHIKLRQGARDEAITLLRTAIEKVRGMLYVAETLSTLAEASRENGRADTTTKALATAIWSEPEQRLKLSRLGQKRLWKWLRADGELRPVLQPRAAASLMEVLSFLSPAIDDRLAAAVFDRLCDEAQGSAKAFDALQAVSNSSPLAEKVVSEVVEPVDRNPSMTVIGVVT